MPSLKWRKISRNFTFEKFYDKSNAAAGTRVRKGLQNLKAKAQELRLDVQSKKTA